MDLKDKKIMVVGGAGFIGSHVVDQLLKEPVKEVIVYDNFFRGRIDNLAQALTDHRCKLSQHGGDVLHYDILERAMEGVDAVFHLAALWILQCHEYPRTAYDVNVTGTFNVIQAAIKNKVKRVVYSSSASVYGNALSIPMTEEPPYNNFTLYGATKIAGEHLFKSMGSRYGLPWVGLRYMNVYGPRQDYSGAYTAVMHKVLDRIDQGLKPMIYGDGSQQYDFVSVRDIARANILAMKAETNDQCYNVGRGIGTSVKDLTSLLLGLCESKLTPEHVDGGLTFVTNRIGSIEKAENEIGFRWQDDLEEGMRELIKWRREDIEALESRRNWVKGVTNAN